MLCPPPLIIVIITAIIQLLTYSCYLLFILIIYTFSLIPVENVCGFAERVFGQGQPGVLHNIVPSKVTRWLGRTTSWWNLASWNNCNRPRGHVFKNGSSFLDTIGHFWLFFLIVDNFWTNLVHFIILSSFASIFVFVGQLLIIFYHFWTILGHFGVLGQFWNTPPHGRLAPPRLASFMWPPDS